MEIVSWYIRGLGQRRREIIKDSPRRNKTLRYIKKQLKNLFSFYQGTLLYPCILDQGIAYGGFQLPRVMAHIGVGKK